MRRAFQAFLALFGVIVIGISLAHFAIGPQAIIGGVAVNPTMAGEDRFFAGLLLCYGIALLWCARDVQHKRVYIDVLAAAADGGHGEASRRTGIRRALTRYVRGVLRSVCAVLVLFLGGLVSSVAAPAWACGCGAYIPDRAGASVVDERAMVAWDGKTQDILMSFNVSGSSKKAAWIMPVPSAAQVSLGDTEVFEELGRLTAPRVEYRDSWWPTFTWLLPGAASSLESAGAPGGAVNVLGRQRIGPFDVTRLAANDPTALATWLADKGFPRPDGLDANLAPYIADHWEIVAIQLAPAQAGESLSGDLQPLRVSFTSDKLVYPMRLSRSATTPQTVDLYVLADHRMDPTSVPVAGQKPSLEFAGHVERADNSPALAAYVGDGAFLTQWNDYIYKPELIDGDYVFEPAASDTPFQHVIYRTRDHGDITGLVLLAVLAACVVVLIVVLARRRRRKASV